MKLKFYFYTFLSFSLTIIILTFPAQCLSFALKGLNLWFERMIPTLFPFMVLSGVIIRMNLTGSFVKILNPVLGRLFSVRSPCVYGMVIGFLCGFPMGAHVAAQLYEQKQISRPEASFLLAFCNNIGPVYFLSFVLPTLGISRPAPFLIGMYALPFLYGLFLRYTVFSSINKKEGEKNGKTHSLSLLEALDDAIFQSLFGIAKLGGYMIFFNLLFILPALACRLFSLEGSFWSLAAGGAGCFLEITGGIGQLGNQAPYLVLCLLPFGGLSCIAQTFSMIKNTDLSISEYVMHKMILTALTVFYYLFLAKTAF